MELKNWGACPYCGSNDGYLNVGRTHWFICREHKIRWWVGCNIWPTWKHETEEDWTRNAALLADYAQVEPRANGRRSVRKSLTQSAAQHA